MTWRYWKLVDRIGGVYKFAPVLEAGGAQRTVQHAYIDPTKARPSEMLMVWSHGDAAERAAQIVNGVYTLEPQQLHDLQQWCAAPPLSKRPRALTRATCSMRSLELAPDNASESEDEAPRGTKRKPAKRAKPAAGRGRGRGKPGHGRAGGGSSLEESDGSDAAQPRAAPPARASGSPAHGGAPSGRAGSRPRRGLAAARRKADDGRDTC